MPVPSISPSLFMASFIPSIVEKQGGIPSLGAPISKEDLFTATQALYLSHLHQLVMQSWQSFSESIKATARDSEEAHRTHSRRKSEEESVRLEGERRGVDTLMNDPILFTGANRQAGKFSVHLGSYIDGDGRHLNSPA